MILKKGQLLRVSCVQGFTINVWDEEHSTVPSFYPRKKLGLLEEDEPMMIIQIRSNGVLRVLTRFGVGLVSRALVKHA